MANTHKQAVKQRSRKIQCGHQRPKTILWPVGGKNLQKLYCGMCGGIGTIDKGRVRWVFPGR